MSILNIIETERLILRSWRIDDYLDAYQINSDDKVNPYAGCPVIKDIEKIKSKINFLMLSDVSYAIELKSEQKVIGVIGFDEIIPDNSLGELNQRYIGYRFSSRYWGEGYATEASKALINYLFNELNLDLIWCSHYDFNLRSKNVINKNNFKYKFTRNVKLAVLNNTIVEELFYAIFKSEYN